MAIYSRMFEGNGRPTDGTRYGTSDPGTSVTPVCICRRAWVTIRVYRACVDHLLMPSCPVGLLDPHPPHGQTPRLAREEKWLSHTQGSILVVKEVLSFDGRARAEHLRIHA
jgi:hypothetical protein